MKKMMAMAVTAAMLVMTAVTGCSTPAGNGAGTAGTQTGSEGTQQESQKTADPGDGKKVIGVSLMTLQYEFFQDMKAGIEAAAGDDYKIVFNDPALDLQTQIDAVENFCAQNVDAIILNAVDAAGIVTALETAEEKGIPVITVDMKPSAGTYVTYIGSDNFLGGELAARWTADKYEGESPNIVLLTNPLSSAAVERIDGFKETIAEIMPDAKIIAEQGADTREAFMSTMEDLLTANPEIDLVFAYSAQGGLGAYDAIQAAGRDGAISIIGFDASEEEQAAIAEKGCYKGSIIQFPDKLGQTCVESVTRVLNGETLDKEIGVEVGVYTADGILYLKDLQ